MSIILVQTLRCLGHLIYLGARARSFATARLRSKLVSLGRLRRLLSARLVFRRRQLKLRAVDYLNQQKRRRSRRLRVSPTIHLVSRSYVINTHTRTRTLEGKRRSTAFSASNVAASWPMLFLLQLEPSTTNLEPVIVVRPWPKQTFPFTRDGSSVFLLEVAPPSRKPPPNVRQMEICSV